MKQLYVIDNIYYCLYLNTGKIIKYDSLHSGGRFIYKYGTMPDNKYEEYLDWNLFLHKALNYINEYNGSKTKFKKKIYIEDYHYGFGKIFKDEFEKFTIEIKYKLIKEDRFPSIETLENDLGFITYSELVFDRDNDLKKLMLHN